MSLRALSGEHEAKKLLQSKYQIRTAVFWGLQAFHEFKFSPFKTRFIQKPLQSRSQLRTAVFRRLEIPMSLRATSDECEAKNRCKVGDNYEQRFFAVHGYLVS